MGRFKWHELAKTAEQIQLQLGKPKLIRNVYRYLIKKYVSGSQTILDFGCGACLFFKILKKRKIKFTGIGVDIEKVSTEFPIYQSIERLPNVTFDLCLMHHVIEHMDYQQSFKIIKKLYQRLKSSGLIVIATPNTFSFRGAMGYLSDPTHIRVYTPCTITYILKKAGFQVIDYKNVYHFFSLADVPRYPFRQLLTFLLGWDFVSDSILVIGKKS